jgi:hypothetical protein
LAAAAVLLSLGVAAAACPHASKAEIAVSAVKAKRTGADFATLLVTVESKSAVVANTVELSCVFTSGADPIHETALFVEKVPAGGKAFKQVTHIVRDQFDGASCRVVKAW